MQHPSSLIVRNRKITAMSAVLLPFDENQQVDWESFDAQLKRTIDAGHIPAVNMDTGFANLLDESTRIHVLSRTQALAGENFIAGAFVADEPDSPFNLSGYCKAVEAIQAFGGTPIVFQSFGLVNQDDLQIVFSYQQIAERCDKFFAFELGAMFAPFGKIYSLEVYRELMEIKQCLGAKHSSLERELEWQRLALRNNTRDDFLVLTGNDLAIDMVMYGSDYLLGLSTFCPDLFARRDAYWETGDSRFYALNDVLQYLGFFAFRNPTSAYKHSAAMFLKQRSWIKSDLTHPKSVERPDSDRAVLFEIGKQLGLEMEF